MDALSEVLRLAHFRAGFALDATGHEPWCIAVPASQSLARACVVISGECVLQSSSAEATLRAGDFAFMPGGEAHLVASSHDVEAVSLSALQRTPVAGEPLPVRIGGTGAATRVILLTAAFERHLAETLFGALPRLVVVDLHGAAPLDWLVDASSLALSSSDAPFLGASATRTRLAEIVFIEALARFVQTFPPGGTGWLAGLNDRYVGRALALVHGRPSEAWTVEKLGRQVGLSRSALAERFGDVMGEPIFAFLTRWRLMLAADFLLTTTRPVKAIAAEAGYESAAAFAAAFRRAFGKAPTAWRRKRKRGR
jgi:AraC family transcriptional regulator, alkane utilization regulator